MLCHPPHPTDHIAFLSWLPEEQSLLHHPREELQQHRFVLVSASLLRNAFCLVFLARYSVKTSSNKLMHV